MMGPKQEAQAALFYEFSLEDHVPQDHLLRSIDRFVDLSGIRAHLSDFDLSPKFPPSLHGVLGVKSVTLGGHFVHVLSLHEFHRRQVA